MVYLLYSLDINDSRFQKGFSSYITDEHYPCTPLPADLCRFIVPHLHDKTINHGAIGKLLHLNGFVRGDSHSRGHLREDENLGVHLY